MKSGTYSINIDGYTSLDGWLDVGGVIILGCDHNDSVWFDRVGDAALRGSGDATGFSLIGNHMVVDVEPRRRFRGA